MKINVINLYLFSTVGDLHEGFARVGSFLISIQRTLLIVSDRSCANPPGPDRCTAVACELLDRSHIPFDDPVIDVSNAKILGIVEVVNIHLPGSVGSGQLRTVLLDIQLLNRKTVLARHRDMVGVAVGANPSEAGGMIRKGEIKTVNVARDDDVVGVGVFVDNDAGVIAGHRHVAQDGQGRVVAERRDQPLGAVGRLGGLHVV